MARDQFDYPEKSWAEGKMRKRGEKVEGKQYAKMDRLQRTLPGEGGQLAEMDRAAGMGVAARGGPSGTLQVPAAVVPTQKITADVVATHKDFIKDNMNELAQGNMTPDVFKRILKQFGWEGDPQSAQFKDPNGEVHRIEAEAK